MSDGKIPASPIGRPRTSGVDRGQLHMARPKVLEQTIWCGRRQSDWLTGPGRNEVHSADCARSQYPACATPGGRAAFVFSLSAFPRGDREGFSSGIAKCGKLGVV